MWMSMKFKISIRYTIKYHLLQISNTLRDGKLFGVSVETCCAMSVKYNMLATVFFTIKVECQSIFQLLKKPRNALLAAVLNWFGCALMDCVVDSNG